MAIVCGSCKRLSGPPRNTREIVGAARRQEIDQSDRDPQGGSHHAGIRLFAGGMEKENQREQRASSGNKIRYDATPIEVPSVFVMISLIPESRIGRSPCRISMVRLTVVPRAIVASAARIGLRLIDHNAKKQTPKGTKPTMFLNTALQ
jgi:hypothetical protein